MQSAYLISHSSVVCLLIVFYVRVGRTVPKQPQITKFTCYETTAVITWKFERSSTRDYASRILYYVVQYNTSFSPDQWITNRGDINPIIRHHSVILSPWVDYTFRIIAKNKDGGSPPSNPTAMCSTPANFPQKILENVNGHSAPNCGITVTWSPLEQIDHNGPGFKYKVIWKLEGTWNVWESQFVEKWRNSETIKNLKSSSWYLIRVTATNDIGDSNVPSQTVRAKSGNCSKLSENLVFEDMESEPSSTTTDKFVETTTSGSTTVNESIILDNFAGTDVNRIIFENLKNTIAISTTTTTEPEYRQTIPTTESEAEFAEQKIDVSPELFVYPKISQVAIEMEPIQLRCIKSGEFQPTFSWARNNKSLHNDHRFQIDGKGDMVISEVHRHDAGEFRCHVSTNISTKISVVSLTVLAKDTQGTGIYLFYALAGGVVVISMFCAGYIHQNRSMKKTRRLLQQMTSTDIEVYLKGIKEMPLFKDPEKFDPLTFPYDDAYEIPKEDLCVLDIVIGTGAYGIVFKGVLKQLGKKETVAVKTVDAGTETIFFKALISELKIMSYIGKHPNVISLIGCVTTNIKYRNLYLVLEYCENGNMESYLRNNRKSILCDQPTKKPNGNTGEEVVITPSMLYKWALEIACGMNFLAYKKIVHGDLATRNVLLTSCRTAKITDFGLSKHLYKDAVYMKVEKIPVPWKWMSLEGLRYNVFSTESDMWSYGITLWEIFSLGQVPYPGDSGNCEFIKNILDGKRLSRPIYASDEIFNTMLLMWDIEPESRPTFKTVIPILENELAGDNDVHYTVL